MIITMHSTSRYTLFRERGSQYAVIQRIKDRAGKRSPPISLQEIDSLGLLSCSKTEFDRIARKLCTISKRDKDQQEDDVVSAPVTLPNKLTRAERQKLKKQQANESNKDPDRGRSDP